MSFLSWLCSFDMVAGNSFDAWPSSIFGDVPGLFLSGLSVGLDPPGETCGDCLVVFWKQVLGLLLRPRLER